MLALAEFESMKCPKCGGPLSECTDAANAGKYTTSLPIRCHSATAQLRAMKDLDKYEYPQALMVTSRLEQ